MKIDLENNSSHTCDEARLISLADFSLNQLGILIGDIVICPAYAEKNGKQSLDLELELLTIHGVLHLLGFDHEDINDEVKMFGLQDEFLSKWRSIK